MYPDKSFIITSKANCEYLPLSRISKKNIYIYKSTRKIKKDFSYFLPYQKKKSYNLFVPNFNKLTRKFPNFFLNLL